MAARNSSNTPNSSTNIHIVVDNSNLFIGAQLGQGKNGEQDASVRINVANLVKIIEDKIKQNIKTRIVGGSKPPRKARVWIEWEKCNYECLLGNRSMENEHLILITGDGNANDNRTSFPDIVSIALQYGWTVDIRSWKASLSSKFLEIQKEYPSQIKINYLDEFRSKITFKQEQRNRWHERQNQYTANNQEEEEEEATASTKNPTSAIISSTTPDFDPYNLSHQRQPSTTSDNIRSKSSILNKTANNEQKSFQIQSSVPIVDTQHPYQSSKSTDVNKASPTAFQQTEMSTPLVSQKVKPSTFVDNKSNRFSPPPSNTIAQNTPSKIVSKGIPLMPKKLSDPTTPTSQQSCPLNQEQEEPDAPVSLAEERLLAKNLNTKLRDQNTLVVDRSDPYLPLHSVRSFEDLNLKPDLLKGIYNMGFRSPSRIQEITLPKLMNNPPTNIIAQSQSGTGKTAAFSLTVLSRIDPSIKSPQALILAPTFELAVHIGYVMEKMAQFLPEIKFSYAVRDPVISKRANLVRNQLLTEQIVIGTPGTVEEWCLRRRVIDLSSLRMCCVDEADIMINTGSCAQQCVDLVKGLDHSNCQMMLFSATYSDEVMTFARQIVQNPVVLRLKREKQALNNIRQYYIRCYDPQQKYLAIEQIYAYLTVGQAMIFCRTKSTARDLAVRMANQQHSVRELTGALDIEQRASIINQFREGLFRVLISTNILVRGIHIDDVTLVINYDMPVTPEFQPDYEAYLHRICRCGRFGKLGRAFNLIGSENDFGTMKSIEQYFSHPIEEITIEGISHLETDQE